MKNIQRETRKFLLGPIWLWYYIVYGGGDFFTDDDTQKHLEHVLLVTGRGRRPALKSDLIINNKLLLQIYSVKYNHQHSWDDVERWMKLICPGCRKSFRRVIDGTVKQALSIKEKDREAFYNTVFDVTYIGEHCSAIDITRPYLSDILNITARENISNGVLYELHRLQISENLTIDNMFLVLERLTPQLFLNKVQLRKAFEDITKKFKNLNKCKQRNYKSIDFLNLVYIRPDQARASDGGQKNLNKASSTISVNTTTRTEKSQYQQNGSKMPDGTELKVKIDTLKELCTEKVFEIEANKSKERSDSARDYLKEENLCKTTKTCNLSRDSSSNIISSSGPTQNYAAVNNQEKNLDKSDYSQLVVQVETLKDIIAEKDWEISHIKNQHEIKHKKVSDLSKSISELKAENKTIKKKSSL